MTATGTTAAVLGLGASGFAAATLLLRHGARVTVLDGGAPDPARVGALRDAGAEVVLGPAADALRADHELCVVSPGLGPDAPTVANFLRQGARLTGELELASRFCSRPVVAVTGTNGKTTTTELVARALACTGLRTLACGNIGRPFSDALRDEADTDVFVVEVSSFQLETVTTFRPRVAVWLNLTPDHLDRYRDMAEYRTAKLRVFANQTAEDFAVVNGRDALPPLAARRITFSAFAAETDFWCKGDSLYHHDRHLLDVRDTHLRGVHNAENLQAALGVAVALGRDLTGAVDGVKGYRPLAHRCETVGTVGGVVFVNDSKATNLDALAMALEGAERPVVLIAGGKDKGFGFEPLRPLVARKVKRAVLIGETAAAVASAWAGCVACEQAPDLRTAVRRAAAAAAPGDVVLLSPGTSSYDMFRDYADRGEQFRQIVQELNPL